MVDESISQTEFRQLVFDCALDTKLIVPILVFEKYWSFCSHIFTKSSGSTTSSDCVTHYFDCRLSNKKKRKNNESIKRKRFKTSHLPGLCSTKICVKFYTTSHVEIYHRKGSSLHGHDSQASDTRKTVEALQIEIDKHTTLGSLHLLAILTLF
jgi:hypothetical protein